MNAEKGRFITRMYYTQDRTPEQVRNDVAFQMNISPEQLVVEVEFPYINVYYKRQQQSPQQPYGNQKEYPLYDYYTLCPTARYVGGVSKYVCECPQPLSCPGVIAVQKALKRQSQNQEWQPHAENLTEHTARDYESFYREQGYEVKIVPSRRYAGRYDMYIKRR